MGNCLSTVGYAWQIFLRSNFISETPKMFYNLKNNINSRPAKLMVKWRGQETLKKYCQPRQPRLAGKKDFWILEALEWLRQ